MKQFILASFALLVIVTIAVDVDGSKCQQPSQQGRCAMDCYQQECNCENDAAANITKCNQHCSQNATDCPKMMCSGTADQSSSCGQYCSKNSGRCKMVCFNVPSCIQECSYGLAAGCDYIKCSSSDSCHQTCANCTMECAEDVKTCHQRCTSGKCILKCSAKNCQRDCSGAECVNYKTVDSTVRPNNTACDLLPGNFGKPFLPTLFVLAKFIQ